MQTSQVHLFSVRSSLIALRCVLWAVFNNLCSYFILGVCVCVSSLFSHSVLYMMPMIAKCEGVIHSWQRAIGSRTKRFFTKQVLQFIFHQQHYPSGEQPPTFGLLKHENPLIAVLKWTQWQRICSACNNMYARCGKWGGATTKGIHKHILLPSECFNFLEEQHFMWNVNLNY